MSAVAVLRRLLALLALCACTAHADERILSYHADIAIAADGGMDVTETIRVRAEGVNIRRGIYRDFPTDYHDRFGHRYKVAFEPVSALRDGRAEPWHSEAQTNGVRVYFGDEDVFLAPGRYTYTFRYRTTRQLGFFDDHDELFWNVTGNGWDFPIDRASASIALPRPVAASQLRVFGYTGVQDSREAALTAQAVDGGARYAATRGLAPREGLSVVLEFPKGVIEPPTRARRAQWLLADNASLLLTLLGLLAAWAYYGWAWRRFGRDPAPGVRTPLYEPPQGYSPASLRYVRRMGYDKDTFAAALLGLAAKGWLDIHEDEDEVITLVPTGRSTTLAPGERALIAKLFPGGKPVKLKQSIHATMQAAIKAHKAALAADFEKKYFNAHRGRLVPGVLISLAALLAGAFAVPGELKFPAMFLIVWLAFWSIGVFALLGAVRAAWHGARGVTGHAGAVVTTLFAVPFLAGEVGGLVALALVAGLGFLVGFILLIGTNLAFYQWMKAPTQDGARLLDKIEGFRWYLGVAEKQELDARYRLDARPELFSAYLPYAFALDVGQAWAERFAQALPEHAQQQARPTWYHGHRDFSAGAGLVGFSSGLGSSLAGAVSSSSTSPGSSSGSSGGSGGGGGGGGGGGW